MSVWKSAPPPDPRITDTEPDRLAPLAPPAPMAPRGLGGSGAAVAPSKRLAPITPAIAHSRGELNLARRSDDALQQFHET